MEDQPPTITKMMAILHALTLSAYVMLALVFCVLVASVSTIILVGIGRHERNTFQKDQRRIVCEIVHRDGISDPSCP